MQMTDQNKMPDEISLFRCECEGDIKWSEDSSDALATYVNEDIYTAVCAERGALRALCEWMAIRLRECTNVLAAQPTTCVKSMVIGDSRKALAAYEKHKAGE